jgi:drug/metabolite transporter (DMT)-like permease
MNWLLLTFLAVLSRSFQSITMKMLTNHAKVSPMTQSLLATLAAFILAMLVSPFIGGVTFSQLNDNYTVVTLVVVSQTIGNIFFFKGLSKLDAGVTAIAFSSILLWGTILSVLFLDSSFELKQVFGIVILGAAIVLVQKRKNIKHIDLAVIYVLFSAMLFAVFQVSSAELAKTMSTGTYLFIAYGGTAALTSLVYAKQVRKDFRYLAKQRTLIAKSSLRTGLCSVGYFVFSFFAYSEAPDRGIVVVLLTSQVILSVLLGIILLKERDRLKIKLIAGVLAVIAGILIRS